MYPKEDDRECLGLGRSAGWAETPQRDPWRRRNQNGSSGHLRVPGRGGRVHRPGRKHSDGGLFHSLMAPPPMLYLNPNTQKWQDDAGSLLKPDLPDISSRSDSQLLESLGDAPSAENPQLAVTGGGAFKTLTLRLIHITCNSSPDGCSSQFAFLGSPTRPSRRTARLVPSSPVSSKCVAESWMPRMLCWTVAVS